MASTITFYFFFHQHPSPSSSGLKPTEGGNVWWPHRHLMVSGPGLSPARVRSGPGFLEKRIPQTGQVKKGVMVSARLSPLDFIPSPDPTQPLREKGEGSGEGPGPEGVGFSPEPLICKVRNQ